MKNLQKQMKINEDQSKANKNQRKTHKKTMKHTHTQKNVKNHQKPDTEKNMFSLTTFSQAKMSTMGRASLRINKVLFCRLL